MKSAATSNALLPFSGLYAAGVKLRRALYKAGAIRVHDLGVPVISVGNITAGGTGKTPLVEQIARYLAGEGKRVCILTRGYGRANSNQRVLVSDSRTILANVEEAGDEGFMLAEKLLGKAAVVCDRDRVAAGAWAITNLQSDVFILDDGFQHLRVERNLNIVTIDATNPWSNCRLLPAGLLREPRPALRRADCIVITRANQSESVDSLRQEIDRFSAGRPIFISRTKTSKMRALSSSTTESVAGPVGAFCAVGNARSFFTQLRNDGHTLSFTRAFPDHHFYSQSDVDSVLNEAKAHGASALVTTAKDEVKLRQLRFDLPCYVADVDSQIDDCEKFRQLIDKSISS